MGIIIYNARSIRSKKLPYIDVLSESINNALRLLIGWFAVTSKFMPSVSIALDHWWAMRFLWLQKDFLNTYLYRDETKAALYRKSFEYYNEKSLLISAVFYSLLSIFFCGIY